MTDTPAKGSPEEQAAMLAWLDEVADALGLDRETGRAALGDVLALTSTIAHNRSRPAAPVTAFLIGLVAGREDAEASSLIAQIRQLAEQ
ncbi:DUF6457 domain-containing protein [Corynebacterium terpenotabidum]|nr:DUF6457 domain-containing protein [Corynebacterium terpenotabidum]